jgi:hypothetical protein
VERVRIGEAVAEGRMEARRWRRRRRIRRGNRGIHQGGAVRDGVEVRRDGGGAMGATTARRVL